MSTENSTALNKFAFDLLRKVCEKSNKNELVSPFSILTALNMALIGAKNNTEKELFEGLRYNVAFKNQREVHSFMQKLVADWTKEDLPFTLSIANRVLLSKLETNNVNEDYANQLKLYYNSDVDEVDFVNDESKVTVSCNKWVESVTKGKITEILKTIDPATVALIMNAIYFKGVWEEPFDEEFTEPLPFYNFGDKDKQTIVPLMYKSEVETCLLSTKIDNEELQMLELPYNGNVSLNILMTKSLNGLQKILPKISFDTINKMEIVEREIDDLWLPKFKIESEYQLVDYLKMLGINDAFCERADFSGIRNEKDICISEVVHKATIEVNEENTVAAASTEVKIVPMCAKIDEIQFRVDHPFLYLLREKSTGVILFAGKVDEL